jgi:hypothetical protein
MSIKCKTPDDQLINSTWKFVKEAWIPAITVCNQNLSPVKPLDYTDYKLFRYELQTITPAETITINLNTNRTIVQFETIVNQVINFNITNKENCELGDEIIIFIESTEGYDLILQSNDFQMNNSDSLDLSRTANNVWCFVFTFNGEKFLSTYEHC